MAPLNTGSTSWVRKSILDILYEIYQKYWYSLEMGINFHVQGFSLTKFKDIMQDNYQLKKALELVFLFLVGNPNY